MTKIDYMKRHNITARPVTKEDREQARTDYQRNADYIISYDGAEWYSVGLNMRDLFAIVRYCAASQEDYKANAGRKSK